MIRFYAMVGCMGLISSHAVIDAAKQLDDTIIKTYLGPNLGISRRLRLSASRK